MQPYSRPINHKAPEKLNGTQVIVRIICCNFDMQDRAEHDAKDFAEI